MSRKIATNQREINALLASLPTHPSEPDRLYSIDHLRSLFIRFSLSEESIQLHSQAKQLSNHLSLLLRDTHSAALQRTLHLLNEKLRADQNILVGFSFLVEEQSITLMALIMTYIPVCSVKYFPLEKVLPFLPRQEESSLRYTIWKLLETYFDNCQWDPKKGYYSKDNRVSCNLLSVHPFVLFFATILSFSCMQAIMPIVSFATVYGINEWSF